MKRHQPLIALFCIGIQHTFAAFGNRQPVIGDNEQREPSDSTGCSTVSFSSVCVRIPVSKRDGADSVRILYAIVNVAPVLQIIQKFRSSLVSTNFSRRQNSAGTARPVADKIKLFEILPRSCWRIWLSIAPSRLHNVRRALTACFIRKRRGQQIFLLPDPCRQCNESVMLARKYERGAGKSSGIFGVFKQNTRFAFCAPHSPVIRPEGLASAHRFAMYAKILCNLAVPPRADHMTSGLSSSRFPASSFFGKRVNSMGSIISR